MQLGRTVDELERSLTAKEYRLWLAFYQLDPWGEQRADMRMASLSRAVLMPHSRQSIDPRDLLLFPDDAHDLPEGASEEEQAMMLKMSRIAGD